MSFVLLPKILSVLKIRKQKLDFLYKMSILYRMRVLLIDSKFFSKNLKLLSNIVKLSLTNITSLLKK